MRREVVKNEPVPFIGVWCFLGCRLLVFADGYGVCPGRRDEVTVWILSTCLAWSRVSPERDG
jgi:hypothetical protein